MKVIITRTFGIVFAMMLTISYFNGSEVLLKKAEKSPIDSLIPKIDTWHLTEKVQGYYSENLYEYIDGAAEIYISYDFKELMVARYEKEDTKANVSLEIYDMGNKKNSFGIYSAERFPDSNFISLGTQGYYEEGNLNFLSGRYYIKIFCFDCKGESENFLKLFSNEIEKKISLKGTFPPLINNFPEQGLIPNTEKFILRNFMGYVFFHDGYLADYKKDNTEFECFIIEAGGEEEAGKMLNQFLEAKKNEVIQKISLGYVLNDRYYHNFYLAKVDDFLCGVINIKDGYEKAGEQYLNLLVKNLKKG